MPTHAEKTVLPYSPELMFDLVADIEKYPEFLPWCLSANIHRREGNILTADMTIGFKVFREKFVTRVTLDRPRRIDVSYSEGPFRYLNNHWLFEETEDRQCLVDFMVDFEFSSLLLEKMIGVVFNEAVQIMISAFEKRARKLYG